MKFKTITLAGADALDCLNMYRASYPSTGEYPFLLGDKGELERIEEAAELNEQDAPSIIRAASNFQLNGWIADQRVEAEEYGLSPEAQMGEWPGEIIKKGSIGLHKDLLSGKIKAEIYLGLAKIEQPWHLPAAVQFGGWNDCPEAKVHCAFFRMWQEKYGAEITGIGGDIVECQVKRPPTDQQAATELACEQYWYCSNIVVQGTQTISNLAATLINSRYWFFWWD